MSPLAFPSTVRSAASRNGRRPNVFWGRAALLLPAFNGATIGGSNAIRMGDAATRTAPPPRWGGVRFADEQGTLLVVGTVAANEISVLFDDNLGLAVATRDGD